MARTRVLYLVEEYQPRLVGALLLIAVSSAGAVGADSRSGQAAPPAGDAAVMPIGPEAPSAARTVNQSIESRPLGAPHAPALGADRGAKSEAPESSAGWMRTILALGAVIALLVVLKLVIQKVAGRRGGLLSQLGAGGRAPSGVLEVLGRYPVSRGQSLVLLRMDRRVLLLSQTSQGLRLLTEVCDPEDVASLLIKTRDDEGASTAAKFTSLLREMERDPAIVAEERGGTALTEPGPSSPRLRLGALMGVRE